MVDVVLSRFEESFHGTRGKLFVNNEFFCYSIEPPWRGNMPNRSCIPEGKYKCIWHKSPRYNWVYLLVDVKDRSHILIHSGNYGGDTEQGFRTHTKGCILLGRKLGILGHQRAVLISRPTVRRFNDFMHENNFLLTIRNDYN